MGDLSPPLAKRGEEFGSEVTFHAVGEDSDDLGGGAEFLGDEFGGLEVEAGARPDGVAGGDQLARGGEGFRVVDFESAQTREFGFVENGGDAVGDAGDARAEAAALGFGWAGEIHRAGENWKHLAASHAEPLVDAHQRATGAHAADHGLDVTSGDLVEDFARGMDLVGERVVGVRELIGEKSPAF